MTTRINILALAAIAALSLSALASTSASASQFGSYGGIWAGGHHQMGGGWGGGFTGQDGPIRGSHVWRPPHTHNTYNPCDCLPQARPTYVPVQVPVYVPVRVPVRVEVPVPVRVPVYVPAPQPTYVAPPVQQTAAPCDCEEGYQMQTQQTQEPRPLPHTYPGQGPQYDKGKSANFAATAIEKK